MSIEIKTLQEISAALKRRARKQEKPVHDDFMIELLAYSQHPVLDVLTDEEQRVVIETIGNKAIDKRPGLDAGFDSCDAPPRMPP